MVNDMHVTLSKLDIVNSSLETILTLIDLDVKTVTTIVQESVTSEKEGVVDTVKRLVKNIYRIIIEFFKKASGSFKEVAIFISGKERILREMNQKTLGEAADVRDKLRTALLDPKLSSGLLGLMNGKDVLEVRNQAYYLKGIKDNSIRLSPISIYLNPKYQRNNVVQDSYLKEMSSGMKDLSSMETTYVGLVELVNQILDVKLSIVSDILNGKEKDTDKADNDISNISVRALSRLNTSDIMSSDSPLENRQIVRVNPSLFLSDTAQNFVEQVVAVLVGGKNLYRLTKNIEKGTMGFEVKQKKILSMIESAPQELVSKISKYAAMNEPMLFTLLREYRESIVMLVEQSLNLSLGIVKERGRVYIEIMRYLKKRNTQYR